MKLHCTFTVSQDTVHENYGAEVWDRCSIQRQRKHEYDAYPIETFSETWKKR